ncbi:MAG: hypothetical protein HWE22_06680 [Flavobacteriales bacterium]|nr:hypothetical protein [Flavobacteriales bacterium]
MEKAVRFFVEESALCCINPYRFTQPKRQVAYGGLFWEACLLLGSSFYLRDHVA